MDWDRFQEAAEVVVEHRERQRRLREEPLFERCDNCGERVRQTFLVEHRENCDGDSGTFAGECPMCGEPYESYLSHLEECDAAN